MFNNFEHIHITKEYFSPTSYKENVIESENPLQAYLVICTKYLHLLVTSVDKN